MSIERGASSANLTRNLANARGPLLSCTLKVLPTISRRILSPTSNMVVLSSENGEALCHGLGEVFEECKELYYADINSKRLTMVFHGETYDFVDVELDI